MICVAGSYVTVPRPVTALTATVPLLNHVVIVQPVALQFFPPSALLQNRGPVTPPGAIVGAGATTELVAKAVLFAVLESPGLEIARVKVTDAGAPGSGITGIRKVSSASGAIVVVFVQVTVVPT